VYRTTCCIVPEAARHDQYVTNTQDAAERDAGRTMDEFEVLADIGAPASQIVMHPHRDHQEILVCVHVNPRERVEI
jgi:hypothetical protein